MSDSTVDRRSVLRRVGGGFALLVLAPVAAAVEGCGKKELSCSSTTGLTPADIQTRTALQYVDHAADPAKPCRSCRLFRSAGEAACGGCEVVKGPIHPGGSCSAWAART